MTKFIVDGVFCFFIDFLFINLISRMFSYKLNNRSASVILLIYTVFSEFLYYVSAFELSVVIKVLIMLFVLFRTVIISSIILKKFDWNVVYFGLIQIILSQIPDSLLLIISPDIDAKLRDILVPIMIIVTLTILYLFMSKNGRLNVAVDAYKKIGWFVRIIILIALWVFTLYLTVVIDPEERAFSMFIRRIFTLPMFIIMGVFVAFIVSISVSDKKNNEITILLSEQIDEQVRYFEKLNKMNDDIRSFRHDINNHFICLRSLLKNNLISEAVEYINDIEQISSIREVRYKTGNFIVDSLLDDKADRAAEFSAEIVFNGIVPTIGISNADICIIFSNALDNAIEACAKRGGGVINIKSDFRQGLFFLEISNPVPDDMKIKDVKRLSTSKGEKKLHGFGMLNIHKTAKKYNGNSSASAENGIFCLNVELQLNNEYAV